eukprot:2783134-Rhodomonas_salina.6
MDSTMWGDPALTSAPRDSRTSLAQGGGADTIIRHVTSAHRIGNGKDPGCQYRTSHTKCAGFCM